ncbi:MAG: TrkA family potassium uptake protein [Clostridia bacterium]|nr:TrkA family potassium uptake protein [Clostridia bacterium]
MKNQSYAVFGLGRYGLATAKELAAAGAQVLAVDRDEQAVQSAAAFIPLVKCADVTDPAVLEMLGISNFDVVIIAMAEHMEACVMAVMLCKEAGVPTVIVKCASETHGRLLSRVGADQVVIPESESGVRMARNLLSSGFVDVMELSGEVSLIEVPVKTEWVGKSLIELNLRKRYAINVVALKRGDTIDVTVDPAAPMQEGDVLVVIAETAKLHKLKE